MGLCATGQKEGEGFRKAGFHTRIMAHNMIMMDSQKWVIIFKILVYTIR
jgi:hypothetical protein